MKKITLLLLMLISGTVFGQTDISTSAIIIEAIEVTVDNGLDFGRVDNSAGTVIVETDGSETGTKDQIAGSGVAAAKLTITGSANESYNIDLGTATGTLGGMTITDINSDTSGALDGTGKEVVNIGATLNVPDGQTAGTYTGTISVTIGYN